MQTNVNQGMKVFSKLFVGTRDEGKISLGFATPYEENAQGIKRQHTVKMWTQQYRTKNRATFVMNNTPREGFQITDNIKRVYWGGGNVVFRVFDPHGFELEIQSQNLMTLINRVGLEKGGLIPGKCIWGRDGSSNILLHESSEEFKNAVVNAEKLNTSKIDVGSKIIGSSYLLKDASRGRYLGKYWVTGVYHDEDKTESGHDNITYAYARAGEHVINTQLKKLKIKEVVQFEAVEIDGRIRLYKKAPLVQLIEKATMSVVLAANKVKNAPRGIKGKIDYAANRDAFICGISVEKPGPQKFDLVPVTEDEFETIVGNVDRYNYHDEVPISMQHVLYDYPFDFILASQDHFFQKTIAFDPRSYKDKAADGHSYMTSYVMLECSVDGETFNYYYEASRYHQDGYMKLNRLNEGSLMETFTWPQLEKKSETVKLLKQAYEAQQILKLVVVSEGV